MAQVLRELKCQRIHLQTGSYEGNNSSSEIPGIQTNKFQYTSDIGQFIAESDLVISHAGAGTCIEVLEQSKPLIVVVNDSLMHNHQTELAEKLASENVLISCTPSTLCRTLRHFNPNKLKKYEKGDPNNFIRELDKLVGFV